MLKFETGHQKRLCEICQCSNMYASACRHTDKVDKKTIVSEIHVKNTELSSQEFGDGVFLSDHLAIHLQHGHLAKRHL